MFKTIGNITSMLKNAREMQERMQEVQEKLQHVKVEAAAGGGMVTVEANGHQKILAVRIEDSLITAGDKEMIEDLVLAAVNSAMDKAKEAAAEEMSKMAEGMEMPGLSDALSQFGQPGGTPPGTDPTGTKPTGDGPPGTDPAGGSRSTPQ